MMAVSSNVDCYTFKHCWAYHDYYDSSYRELSQGVSSPEFFTKRNSLGYEWQLRLRKVQGKLIVEFELCRGSNQTITLKYLELGLLRANGSQWYICYTAKKVNISTGQMVTIALDQKHLDLLPNVDEESLKAEGILAPGNTLYAYCKFDMNKDDFVGLTPNMVAPCLGIVEKIYEERQKTSDFTLESNDGGRFPCNKSVLAVTSWTLRKLIEESKENMVKLDSSSQVIQEILHNIYLGKITPSLQMLIGASAELGLFLESVYRLLVCAIQLGIENIVKSALEECLHIKMRSEPMIWQEEIEGVIEQREENQFAFVAHTKMELIVTKSIIHESVARPKLKVVLLDN